jgi:cation transport ATPase
MSHSDHQAMADPHTGHKMSHMQGSHDRHAGHSVAMFRDKFWLSFALTIPVVLWSTDVQHWLGYTAPSFPGSKFIPAILGTIVFVYGGLVFIRGAWGELVDRKPGMMTLISLAIVVAFGTSLAATLGFFEIDVWREVASLITIMVLGHWLEMRAISQAGGALNALAALLPDTAERVNGADTQSVPLSELRVGDIVLVRPGARVPADGVVAEGSADVDESMITGESKTVPKVAGARVVAGTVASGGSFASALRPLEARPPFPESCGSSPLHRLPALAHKLLPTVRPRFFFTWQSYLAPWARDRSKFCWLPSMRTPLLLPWSFPGCCALRMLPNTSARRLGKSRLYCVKKRSLPL